MTETPIQPTAHLGLARHIALRYASRIPGGFPEACAIASVALVRAAAAFDPERGRWSTFAGTYMETALRSAARSARRWEHQTRRLSAAVPLPDPADPIHTAVVRADWTLALRRLRTQCSAAGLALLEDCLRHPDDSQLARAERLGCSPSAISHRFQRLRRDWHAVWD